MITVFSKIGPAKLNTAIVGYSPDFLTTSLKNLSTMA